MVHPTDTYFSQFWGQAQGADIEIKERKSISRKEGASEYVDFCGDEEELRLVRLGSGLLPNYRETLQNY